MKRAITVLAVAVGAALAGAACKRDAPHPQPDAVRLRSAEVEPDSKTTIEKDREHPVKSSRGFVQDIEKLTSDNGDYRRVLYTAKHIQLVLMALPPGEHIGAEVHDVDQFFRVEEGTGEVHIGDTRTPIGDGSAIIIPAGAKHDVVNTGTTPLKLYTLYAPPHHRDGVVHRDRAAAQHDHEHFDGKTTP